MCDEYQACDRRLVGVGSLDPEYAGVGEGQGEERLSVWPPGELLCSPAGN